VSDAPAGGHCVGEGTDPRTVRIDDVEMIHLTEVPCLFGS